VVSDSCHALPISYLPSTIFYLSSPIVFDPNAFARIAPQWSQRLHDYSELASTNDKAQQLAESGAEDRTVVLAEHQTTGRGRRGSHWQAESGSGLLFSMIVRPPFERKHWSRLALASGLAVTLAIRETTKLPALVKWPNDVLIANKKCCGILVETGENFAVIGVGLNVYGSPQNCRATSLDKEAGGKLISREAMLAHVLQQIDEITSQCGNAYNTVHQRLTKLCALTGKQVSLNAEGKQLTGRVQRIDEEGKLVIEIDGQLRSFHQADNIRLLNHEG